jgi:hypothetical protein
LKLAFRIFPLKLDLLHDSTGGTMATPGHEFLETGPRAFGNGFNGAIKAVPDPAL